MYWPNIYTPTKSINNESKITKIYNDSQAIGTLELVKLNKKEILSLLVFQDIEQVTPLAFSCLKSTKEAPEKCVKSVKN